MTFKLGTLNAFLGLTTAMCLSSCGGSGSSSSPPTYLIGGTVYSLSGTGLALRNNGGDTLSISSNGTFTFTTPITSGSAYNITVLTQPSGPAQNCSVANGTGTAQSTVTNITVACISEWTWVNGSNFVNDPGVPGTQGVPAPENVPGARNYAFGATDASGNFWLSGGVGYNSWGLFTGLGDLWEFNSAAEWTFVSGYQVDQTVYGTLGVPAPTNAPGARDRAVSWTDPAGNFWLFGGGGWANDLWRYSAGEWTWMGGSQQNDQTGVYGTQGVSALTNVPGARSDMAHWTDSAGNFWLLGGIGFDSYRPDDYGWLNDLWEYSNGQWTWVGGANIKDQYGSYGTQGVAVPTNWPGGRLASVSWTDTDGNFWLFGGTGKATAGSPESSGFLNDLWKYSVSSGQWTWMSGSNVSDQFGVYGTQGIPAPANTPGARQYAVGCTDSKGNLWLFGGSDLGGNLNDLWRYNIRSGQWTWMGGATHSLQNNEPGVYGTMGAPAPNNQPGARHQSVAWTDASGNLWVFGGSGYDSNGTIGWLNDLWKFEP